MSKFAATAAMAIFVVGMAAGYVTRAPNVQIAKATLDGIDPSALLTNVRDLRDETVRDAV